MRDGADEIGYNNDEMTIAYNNMCDHIHLLEGKIFSVEMVKKGKRKLLPTVLIL